MNSISSANSTIRSKLSASSRRERPSSVPFRNTFSRPVSSGWNAAPSSRSGATRPRTRTRPVVGRSTRATTFRSVLLPAPFRPMSAKTSPDSTVRLTSRSAQNSSWRTRRLATRTAYSFRVGIRSCGTRKRTDTPSIAMTGSDTIGELVGPAGEDHAAQRQDPEGQERRYQDGGRLGPDPVVEGPPEQDDQPVDRVGVHQPAADPRGQDVLRVDDRGQVEDDGQEELVQLRDVHEICRQRGQEQPDSECERRQQEHRHGQEQDGKPGAPAAEP